MFHKYVGPSIFAVFSRLFPPLLLYSFLFWLEFINPTTFSFRMVSVSFPKRFRQRLEGIIKKLMSDYYLMGGQHFGELGCEICSEFEYLQRTGKMSHELGKPLRLMVTQGNCSVRGKKVTPCGRPDPMLTGTCLNLS